MHEQQEHKTILLVEDEALIAVIGKRTLQKHGFNVIIASSGEKAITTVQNTPDIDLILMDINLGKGKMDGTEAAEIILRERDIPVLFLSSYTQKEIVEKTEKITSYGYVVKDSGETVLIASIKMAFKLHEAHQKVKQGAEQFRAITNTAIDGFWVVDIEGHILDVNGAYCSMTGYSRDELLKMSIPDLDAIEDKAMARQHMEKLIEKGSDRFESKQRCKDGQIIHVEVSTILTQEQKCLVFIHDITERKRTEQDLRRSKRTFRALLDATSDAAFLLDAEGIYLAMNETTVTRLGKSADTLLGVCAYDHVDADVAQKRRAMVNEVVTSGKPLHFVDQRDGLLLENRLYPIFGAENKVEMVAAYSRDITESELDKEELRYAHARLEALWGIAKIADDDFKSICDKILSEIVVITKSEYGFFGFISEDESVMTIYSWSGEAMKDCSMVDKPQHYPISEAGVWAEAIRQRKPFILNDYIIPHGAKKGYPDGHVTLTNLMVVPIFSGSRIVSVAAVANKAVSYNDGDINEITAFVSSVQSIIERKRAEEQLLKNIERLDMAQTAANAGVWDWEIPTGHIEWSNHMFHLLGLDPLKNTASFETWKSILHPDDIETARLRIDQVLKQQAVLNSDYRVVMPHGQIRWINAVGQGKYDNSGNPIRMIGFCMDVTERKQAEDLQRETEERFRTLATVAPVGIYLTDPDGNCLYANPAWCKMAGLNLEDALGQGWVKGLHPDDRAFVCSSWQQMVESQGKWGMEYRFQTREGTVTTVYGVAAPQYDASGKIIRYIGVNLDITDLKLAEKAQREKDEILSATQRLAKVGGWQWDVATQTMSWTEEVYQIHDLEEDRFIPGSPEHIDRSLECYAPEDRPLIVAAFKNCVERGQSYDLEFPFITFKGRRLWIRTVAQAVLDKGRIVKVVGNIMDITDRKLAEDKIKALLADKELLLRGLHNRIKNNMCNKKSLLSLQADKQKDPSIAAILNDAESRVNNMMVLYDKLYRSADFREISAKEYLTTLIDEILANFPPRESLTVNKQIDDIILDAKIVSPMGIILNELLTNAMRHAFINRNDGRIFVSLSAKDGHITLTVHDNGIGIPESVDIANPEGFGLQLVGILTEQLEGTIRIERENGTRFVLEFEV